MGAGANSRAGRWWRRTSLMQRLALVALVPTLVTATLLVVILTQHQLNSLRGMAQITADAIATQAASVSTTALRDMQRRELVRIAESIGDLPHVARVQIRAADGEILADNLGRSGGGNAETLTVVRDVVDAEQPGRPVLGSVMVDVSLSDAIAAQQASLRNALFALALSVLVAAVIGWQAARWMSAPLRRLVAAVHQLGRGDRHVEVEVTDQTEIGELQRGFNSAALALFDVQRTPSSP